MAAGLFCAMVYWIRAFCSIKRQFYTQGFFENECFSLQICIFSAVVLDYARKNISIQKRIPTEGTSYFSTNSFLNFEFQSQWNSILQCLVCIMRLAVLGVLKQCCTGAPLRSRTLFCLLLFNYFYGRLNPSSNCLWRQDLSSLFKEINLLSWRKNKHPYCI